MSRRAASPRWPAARSGRSLRMMIQDHGEMLVLGSPSEIRERMHMPDADMNAIFIAIVEQARAELAKEGRKPA